MQNYTQRIVYWIFMVFI